MAETKKTRTRKSAATLAVPDISVSDNVAAETITAKPANIAKNTSRAPKRRTKQSLPLDTEVCCVSGVASGKLIYESKRMKGCMYEWDSFGNEQYLDLAELQSMRTAYPAFFEKNWILIDDKEVLDFLRASQYYKYVYSAEDVEALFDKSPDQVRLIVPRVGDGLKKSIAIIARRKYKEGILDSNALIKAFEETTGYTIHDN